jgi:hypothetical protein
LVAAGFWAGRETVLAAACFGAAPRLASMRLAKSS